MYFLFKKKVDIPSSYVIVYQRSKFYQEFLELFQHTELEHTPLATFTNRL